MPQINVYLDDEENKIVDEFSVSHNISKIDAIKQIIRKLRDVKK